jgi:hypothetical protein
MDDKETKPSPLTEEQLTLMALQLNIKMLTSEVRSLEERMMKLDEVYYYVFPDRLTQDTKFYNQLCELLKHSPRPKEK